jgi:hypothetical protein
MTKTDQIALPAMGLLVAPTSAAGSAEPTLIGVVGDKNRFRFLEFLAARIKNPNRHWGIVQILGRWVRKRYDRPGGRRLTFISSSRWSLQGPVLFELASRLRLSLAKRCDPPNLWGLVQTCGSDDNSG